MSREPYITLRGFPTTPGHGVPAAWKAYLAGDLSWDQACAAARQEAPPLTEPALTEREEWAPDLVAEIRRLRDGLDGLRRPHTAVCEHLPEKDDHCNCGAAAYNAQIDALLSENTAEDRYQ